MTPALKQVVRRHLGLLLTLSCLRTQASPGFAAQWVATHANVSAALGKPLLMEEV